MATTIQGQQMKQEPNTSEIFDFFQKYQKYEKQRWSQETLLIEEIKTVYPLLQNLNINSDSFTVTTEHHTLRRSSYDHSSFKNSPTFTCKKDMNTEINTVEEFLAMKEAVRLDYQQCLGVTFYIQFRFDILK